jgi:uncharacterized membrane protein YfcA
MSNSPTAYLLGGAAALLMGFSKTGLPGASIPAIALMAAAFGNDTPKSVGAMLPLLVVGDVFAVIWYRRHADWSRVAGLVPWVLLGMVPGYGLLWLFGSCSNLMRPVLGWMLLTLLTLELARKRFGWSKVPDQWWFGAGLGAMAGFATALANAAGPVMTVYLLSRGLLKEEFVGTAAWFFFLVNLSKAVPFALIGAITGPVIQFDLVVLPALLLGVAAGIALMPRLPQGVFDRTVFLLAVASAVWLVLPQGQPAVSPRAEGSACRHRGQLRHTFPETTPFAVCDPPRWRGTSRACPFPFSAETARLSSSNGV